MTKGALTRRRRSVVVFAGCDPASDDAARTLCAALDGLNVDTTYLGREESAERIAAAVAAERADAVELFLAREAGVLLLRELLRELIRIGRRNVSITAHRTH